MPTSKPKSAEANFREAFERLKASASRVLPTGSQVSQNNVAKEAGCDPSALRKSRYPILIEDIQKYIDDQQHNRPSSERQRLIKARQVTRSKSETIASLKLQRDDATLRLVEAYEKISMLTANVRDLTTKLQHLQHEAGVVSLQSSKPRSSVRGVDLAGGT